MLIILIQSLFLLLASTQRVKVVNFGAVPTESITIHISENIRAPDTQNPQGLDAQAKRDLEDITAIFAMFSLLDELSNAIFLGANSGNKGFLSPEKEANGANAGKRPSQARQSVFDKLIEEAMNEEDAGEGGNNNEDFNEAHVEFKEGKTTIGEENQKKLIENIKNKEETAENISVKEESADVESISLKLEELDSEQPKTPGKSENIGQVDQEKKEDNETVISTRKKTEKIEKIEIGGSKNGKAMVILAAVVVALLLYAFLKCKMVKFEHSADETHKVHQKKAAQD